MDAGRLNGQAVEPTIEIETHDVKNGATGKVRRLKATWQRLNKKKLAAVVIMGVALVASSLRAAQWYVEQRK